MEGIGSTFPKGHKQFSFKKISREKGRNEQRGGGKNAQRVEKGRGKSICEKRQKKEKSKAGGTVRDSKKG